MNDFQIGYCRNCTKPIKIYSMYCGDQSYCSDCYKDLNQQANMSRNDWIRKYTKK